MKSAPRALALIMTLAAAALAAPPVVAETAPAARWQALHPDDKTPLAARLEAAIAARDPATLVPVVYIGATWCGPCKAIKRYKDDPRMQAAFAGALVLELDSDEWPGADLHALGLASDSVPVFFAVDAHGKGTGPRITGAAWGEDVPENMAPPLQRFVASLPR